MPETRVIPCTPLTEEAFAPFGQLLSAEPHEASIAVRDGEDWVLNILSYGPKELVCDHLNAHHKATQALLNLDAKPALLVVAPAGTRFEDPADLDTIRAFVMDGTAAINLGFGTWHWGPYPISDHLHLLNLQGRGFADDNEIVNLVDLLDTVVVAQL